MGFEHERQLILFLLIVCLVKYALDRLPRAKSVGLYASYTNFEKQFGDRAGIEATVLGKRRIQYVESWPSWGNPLL